MGVRVAFLVLSIALAASLAVYLAGCAGGGIPYEKRAAWRGKAEQACLASGLVHSSPYVQPTSEIDGPSACGMQVPLRVSGLLDGKIIVTPTATIDCPLTAALNEWIKDAVEPAAYRNFGRPVVGIRQIASYSCRGRDGRHYGPLSEHSFGNALDIAAFQFAGGQELTVVRGWWHGNARERAFLGEVFAGACREFYTVLGPGSDSYHYNHIHVDLLATNVYRARHYCRPRPTGVPVAEAASDPKSTASISPIPFDGTRD
jgi:hypothetical protein